MCLLISCSWVWPVTYFNKPVPSSSPQWGRTGWREVSPLSRLNPGALVTELYFFSKTILFLCLIPSFSLFCFESQKQPWTCWMEIPSPLKSPRKHCLLLLLLVSPTLKALLNPQRQILWETEIKRKQGEEVDKNRGTWRVTEKIEARTRNSEEKGNEESGKEKQKLGIDLHPSAQGQPGLIARLCLKINAYWKMEQEEDWFRAPYVQVFFQCPGGHID